MSEMLTPRVDIAHDGTMTEQEPATTTRSYTVLERRDEGTWREVMTVSAVSADEAVRIAAARTFDDFETRDEITVCAVNERFWSPRRVRPVQVTTVEIVD